MTDPIDTARLRGRLDNTGSLTYSGNPALLDEIDRLRAELAATTLAQQAQSNVLQQTEKDLQEMTRDLCKVRAELAGALAWAKRQHRCADRYAAELAEALAWEKRQHDCADRYAAELAAVKYERDAFREAIYDKTPYTAEEAEMFQTAIDYGIFALDEYIMLPSKAARIEKVRAAVAKEREIRAALKGQTDD